MADVLVLGARGRIARLAVPLLVEQGHRLTLLARSAQGLGDARATRIVEGDVMDAATLRSAMVDQDVVYANLAGDLDTQGAAVAKAMQDSDVHRLVFVTALGIYDELPEPFRTWNRDTIGASTLETYRRAADIVTSSGLDYTLVRPAWLTDNDEVDYETATRDEQFKGTEVSRKSVATFITQAIGSPARWSRTDIGVYRPGTEGDKPSFV